MTDESTESGTPKLLKNEKSTVVQSEEVETVAVHPKSATQNSEAPVCAKKSKKKKKEGERKDNQQKEMKSTTEETPKQVSTELTPDEQLSRELDWCIEQLELGLRTQKTSSKQREEAGRALKTLRSSKAPLVKKRQVMRAVSGDYRKKMEEDKARQFKLIQSGMSSARVKSVSECKPAFHRRTEKNAQPTNKTDKSRETNNMQGPQDANEHTKSVEEIQGETKPFVFTKSHEEFCFNFNL
ncbi:UPF0488 protein C8orf33 homolog [Myxocyprinus asiaticus]|uniref:UPF0488 protein C8orf33 homolog n=1 Tax=Myxocyprinus asiaticus TaxID=70543 RepID=UPI002223898B|nr:UPF0488 protein C8orf33 homolog [Myxocyprinus asiaticus]